jgi:small subunit ribosomal protein S21
MGGSYARLIGLSSLEEWLRRTGQNGAARVSARLHPGARLSEDNFILFARLPHRTRRAAKGEFNLVQIFVRDNNVDQALKALKKKMQREGSFREMKRHVHYEKPSEKRARQKAEAVRRARKLARKRMQREGLLPPPKPRVPGTGPARG